MGAAIWSCPVGTFANFPVQFVIEFYRNHGLLQLKDRPQWMVIKGGSQEYVQKLTRPFQDRIKLNAPVARVTRNQDTIRLWLSGQTDEAAAQEFDHVVFACHSDQALKILGDSATQLEQDVLKAFPYAKSTAVLHTDEKILPRSRRAWASWNYRVTDFESEAVCVTYNMNILQSLQSQQTYCVTLNGDELIDASKIVYQTSYEHPIFTTERQLAQSRHVDLLQANRTSFCGAYWRNGFHEDGVVSGLRVAEALYGKCAKGSAGTLSSDARSVSVATES